MSWDLDENKKKMLIRSMIALAVIAVAAGVITNIITQQARAQDPVYQCIESDNLPYQAYVTISVSINGQPIEVPANIGMQENCLRPIHTHDNSGLIHIVYDRPYDFKLGHFLWYWGFDIQKYDATTYVNGIQHERYLDTVLRDGMSIIIDFKSKPSGII
ncbi:MAG: hypothetical protein QXU32_11925 [Nitrososphaerales archaeon]